MITSPLIPPPPSSSRHNPPAAHTCCVQAESHLMTIQYRDSRATCDVYFFVIQSYIATHTEREIRDKGREKSAVLFDERGLIARAACFSTYRGESRADSRAQVAELIRMIRIFRRCGERESEAGFQRANFSGERASERARATRHSPGPGIGI